MKQPRLPIIGFILLLMVSPGLCAFTGEVEAEDYLFSLVNEVRQEYGSPVLANDPLLVQAARGHSWEMISLDYFSHYSPLPERETPLLRVAEEGLSEVWVGENIGSEYTSAAYDWRTLTDGLFEGLMNSPPHRENILDPDFNYAGMGIVYSEHDGMNGLHLTQVFMTRRIRLDGLTAELQAGEYSVELWGRQLAPGYLKLIVQGRETEYLSVETDEGGFFHTTVRLPVSSGSHEFRMGMGEEQYGSIEVFNIFRVNTSLSEEKALCYGSGS
ncbi:CAP domain-containing protein [bacterium]|nr:CAP domain-containing protein [bacterium]